MLDNLEEIQLLSDDEVVSREQAKVQHAALSLNLARRISQRAKENWIKDAERNSSYLHQIASFKFKHSGINCLKIYGVLTYDKNKITEETKSFYPSLFSEKHKSRPSFEQLEMPKISVMESVIFRETLL